MASGLRIVEPPGPHPRLQDAVARSALYQRVLGALQERVKLAHARLISRGDVMPANLPDDRSLTAQELDELTWRVYCLSAAMHLSFVRCHPSVLMLAAEWWGSQDQDSWDWFCEAHWP